MAAYWPWFVLGFVALVAVALVARAVLRTVAGFVAEVRHARLVEAPVEIRTVATLREVESRLLAAEDALRSVLRRSWGEWIGFGNPALRQRELVAGWGELVQAQRSLREIARTTGHSFDPGDDAALVEDPMHALAVRKAWLVWGALMLLPWFFRTTYTFVTLRRRVQPLLATVRALEEEVRGVRVEEDRRAATSPGAPPRTAWSRAQLRVA
jgi:hypothetical protein